jgi:hypothetical protein
MKSFWKAIAPRRVLLAGWLTWLVLFLLAPITVNWAFVDVHIEGAILMVGCLVGFILGTASTGKADPAQIVGLDSVGRKAAYPLFWLVLFLAVVGGTFRIYDRYFLRGLASAETFFDQSEVLSLYQTSIFGVLAGPFFPFLLLMPFVYMVYAANVERSYRLMIISIVCLMVIPIESATTGSRSTTLIAGGLILLSVASGIRITIWRIVAAAIGALVLIVVAGEIFIQRVVEFGSYTVAQSAGGGSGYAQTIPASDAIMYMIQSVEDAGLGTRFLFSILHFCQYYLHGVFEFFRVIEEFDASHSLGSYTYPLTNRILSLIFGFPPALDVNPRAGVFSSMFGGMYLDFGWFAPIVCFVYGWVAQLTWHYAATSNVFLRPLYFIMVIAIFFAPVADLTNSSISSYVISSTLLLVIFGRALRAQTKILDDPDRGLVRHIPREGRS